jgi:hypothetical protein
MNLAAFSNDAAIRPGILRIVFLVAFVAAAVIGALDRSPMIGFDEITHLSYIAHIQSTGELWPRLESLRILDEHLRFSHASSYLNHPPLYYDLLATLGPRVEDNPGAILIMRLMNIVIATIGLGALLVLGGTLGLSRLEEYALITALFLTPVLAPLSGTVNNDNLAIAAGCVALLATHQLLRTGASRWLFAAVSAVAVAGMAKLTGLLLVGGLVAGVLAYMVAIGRCRGWWVAVACVAALVAASPYLVFFAQYGSPAPNTPGQIALLTSPREVLIEQEWTTQSFPAYAGTFVVSFIREWMPIAVERTWLQLFMLAAPVFAVLCALSGAGHAAKRILRRTDSPIDVVVVAGFAAAAATAALHLIFSYQRHVAYAVVDGVPSYAFFPDAYPRYYMPLGAIVPLGCALFLAARLDVFARKTLAMTMIAGPIALAIFGAPSNEEINAELARRRSLDIYHQDQKSGGPAQPVAQTGTSASP